MRTMERWRTTEYWTSLRGREAMWRWMAASGRGSLSSSWAMGWFMRWRTLRRSLKNVQ